MSYYFEIVKDKGENGEPRLTLDPVNPTMLDHIPDGVLAVSGHEPSPGTKTDLRTLGITLRLASEPPHRITMQVNGVAPMAGAPVQEPPASDAPAPA